MSFAVNADRNGSPTRWSNTPTACRMIDGDVYRITTRLPESERAATREPRLLRTLEFSKPVARGIAGRR